MESCIAKPGVALREWSCASRYLLVWWATGDVHRSTWWCNGQMELWIAVLGDAVSEWSWASRYLVVQWANRVVHQVTWWRNGPMECISRYLLCNGRMVCIAVLSSAMGGRSSLSRYLVVQCVNEIVHRETWCCIEEMKLCIAVLGCAMGEWRCASRYLVAQSRLLNFENLDLQSRLQKMGLYFEFWIFQNSIEFWYFKIQSFFEVAKFN